MGPYCQCRDCRRAKRAGNVLGSRLLKYLGAGAHRVSAYVPHPRWRAGRRPEPKA